MSQAKWKKNPSLLQLLSTILWSKKMYFAYLWISFSEWAQQHRVKFLPKWLLCTQEQNGQASHNTRRVFMTI